MEVHEMKTITLAGGCFWGVEAYFKQMRGVMETSVGYANGNTDTVTYEAVCTGTTGHAEAVQIQYDHNLISLQEILGAYFDIIDPYAINRQGNDTGTQYRTGIYTDSEDDKRYVRSYMDMYELTHGRKLAVENTALRQYIPAETYHQDYLGKNPGGYCHINIDSLSDNLRK